MPLSLAESSKIPSARVTSVMFDIFLVFFSLLHTVKQQPTGRLGATFKLVRVGLYSSMVALRAVNVGAMDSQRILRRQAFEAFSTFVELAINIVLPFFRKSIENFSTSTALRFTSPDEWRMVLFVTVRIGSDVKQSAINFRVLASIRN